jgi:hypothetical protein
MRLDSSDLDLGPLQQVHTDIEFVWWNGYGLTVVVMVREPVRG